MLFAVTVPYMATVTAKRGTKGKGTKGKAPAPKAPPKAKKKAKKGTPHGQGTTAPLALIASVKAENPLITADEFAVRYNLPLEEVARHRMFVLQYTLDYNLKAAAMRMGYPAESAYDTGKLMLHYPFAQLYLSELQRNASVESVFTAGTLLHKCLEEMNRPDTVKDGCAMTNSATRLAWAKLAAQMTGMLNPVKAPDTPTLRKVMHVAETTGSDAKAWGAHAQASQKALVKSTAIDV